MDVQSQYISLELPVASRERYKLKVMKCGLIKDPYTIDDWIREPAIQCDFASISVSFNGSSFKIQYVWLKSSKKIVIIIIDGTNPNAPTYLSLHVYQALKILTFFLSFSFTRQQTSMPSTTNNTTTTTATDTTMFITHHNIGCSVWGHIHCKV